MKTISFGLLALIAVSSYSQELTPGFVALAVKDIDAQQKWYCDNLGFKVKKAVATVAPDIRFALLDGNSMMIELIEDKKSPGKPKTDGAQPQGIFKFGFNVGAFDNFVSELASKGIKPKYGPFKASGNNPANVIIEDPEGNLIQFFGRE
jgi:catechol 2,3-dioxygenase-like lactoylglutathione lyase family enzyme